MTCGEIIWGVRFLLLFCHNPRQGRFVLDAFSPYGAVATAVGWQCRMQNCTHGRKGISAQMFNLLIMMLTLPVKACGWKDLDREA